jgi:NADH dehydrogenase
VIWTAGTAVNPLIKDLPIPEEHRDQHGCLQVTPTLRLLDFPEVFAAGDCAFVKTTPTSLSPGSLSAGSRDRP